MQDTQGFVRLALTACVLAAASSGCGPATIDGDSAAQKRGAGGKIGWWTQVRTAPSNNGATGADGCTYTIGFWKTHPSAWPVSTLKLGNTTYTKQQLLDIFNTPPAGNGILILAHQLIGAKLNLASGAAPAAIAGAIASADSLIGNLVVPPVGMGSLSSGAVSALNDKLTSYNQGQIGPGHCGEGVTPPGGSKGGGSGGSTGDNTGGGGNGSIGEGGGLGGSSGTGTGGTGSVREGGGKGSGNGGACAINWTEYVTSEGTSVCVPNPTSTGGGASCPAGWTVFVTVKGKTECIPAPTPTTGSGTGNGGQAGGSGTGGPVPVGAGGTCPIDYELYVSSEGKQLCLPVGTGSGGSGARKGTGGTAGGAGALPGSGGSCPINFELYVSSEGASICFPDGGNGTIPIGPNGTCPANYAPVKALEGPPTTCAPIGSPGTGGSSGGTGGNTGAGSTGGGSGSGFSCPIDWTVYITSEGKASCTPTPRGEDCPIDWASYLTSEGAATCLPIPKNGVCSAGYQYDVSSEGRNCI